MAWTSDKCNVSEKEKEQDQRTTHSYGQKGRRKRRWACSRVPYLQCFATARRNVREWVYDACMKRVGKRQNIRGHGRLVGMSGIRLFSTDTKRSYLCNNAIHKSGKRIEGSKYHTYTSLPVIPTPTLHCKKINRRKEMKKELLYFGRIFHPSQICSLCLVSNT